MMKKFLLSLPVLLFPYSIIFALFCIWSGFLMETLFQNNAFLLIFALLFFFVIALGFSITTCALGLIKNWDYVELSRLNMLIKLLSIPAYIMIFIIGILCFITIFTFVVSFILIILDCMAILLSGLIGVCAIKRCYDNKAISSKEMILHSILQFIFCVDIISSIIVFIKAKKAKKQMCETLQN